MLAAASLTSGAWPAAVDDRRPARPRSRPTNPRPAVGQVDPRETIPSFAEVPVEVPADLAPGRPPPGVGARQFAMIQWALFAWCVLWAACHG
jgi:hypothetical protein